MITNEYLQGIVGKHLVGFDELQPVIDDIEPCKSCWLKYICSTQCMANHFAFNMKKGEIDKRFCAFQYSFYRMVFEIVIQILVLNRQDIIAKTLNWNGINDCL